MSKRTMRTIKLPRKFSRSKHLRPQQIETSGGLLSLVTALNAREQLVRFGIDMQKRMLRDSTGTKEGDRAALRLMTKFHTAIYGKQTTA